jgi:hypothetical protein
VEGEATTNREVATPAKAERVAYEEAKVAQFAVTIKETSPAARATEAHVNEAAENAPTAARNGVIPSSTHA